MTQRGPVHVIACDNMARKYEMTGDNPELIKLIRAQREEYPSYDEYRRYGNVTLHFPTPSFSNHFFSLGYLRTSALRQTASFLMDLADRSGYSCKDTAPIIISDRIEDFYHFGDRYDLVMRRKFSHQTFFPLHDVPVEFCGRLLSEGLSDFEGLIILMIERLPEQAYDWIIEKNKKSIILRGPMIGNTTDFWIDKEGHLNYSANRIRASYPPLKDVKNDDATHALTKKIRERMSQGEEISWADVMSMKS